MKERRLRPTTAVERLRPITRRAPLSLDNAIDRAWARFIEEGDVDVRPENFNAFHGALAAVFEELGLTGDPPRP